MPDNDNINNEELVLDETKPKPAFDVDAEFERHEAALLAALEAEGREGERRFDKSPTVPDDPVYEAPVVVRHIDEATAEAPVILSERSESKDLTPPSDILSEAKNPASDSSQGSEYQDATRDSSPEGLGMTDPAAENPDPDAVPALDYVKMTLSAGIAPLEMRFAQINNCYRRLPVAYRSFTYINSMIEGVIPPEKYAYAADETDRGERLARWNIAKAVEAIRAFEAAGRHVDYVTARCPASLLRQPDMYAWMKQLLDGLKFESRSRLCLEFPRTLLYEDVGAARPSLLALKLLKVRTLMTGCGDRDCPVTALVELPVDMVLLSPHVSAMADNRDKTHVFTSFVNFLRTLPVDVLGDGLYNDEQITAHSRADCAGYIPSAGYVGVAEHGRLRMTLEEAVSQKEEDV